VCHVLNFCLPTCHSVRLQLELNGFMALTCGTHVWKIRFCPCGPTTHLLLLRSSPVHGRCPPQISSVAVEGVARPCPAALPRSSSSPRGPTAPLPTPVEGSCRRGRSKQLHARRRGAPSRVSAGAARAQAAAACGEPGHEGLLVRSHDQLRLSPRWNPSLLHLAMGTIRCIINSIKLRLLGA
jgi:hypothetical protein